MKKVYEFVLPKEEKVKETSKEKGEDGSDITVTKEVVKSVNKKYFIKRPTRRLFDDAELFYGVKLAEGIKAGLLTRALLAKRFSNDGGVLSESEKEAFGELYSSVFDKQVELQQLTLKPKEKRSKKENEKWVEVTEFLSEARIRIQEFESNQSSLYDQTAENRARNKTILWWVLHLSHAIGDEGDKKEVPFFEEGDYTKRLDFYDKLEEDDDEYILEVINKFFYYVSFWYVSKTSDSKEFSKLIKFAEQADLGVDDSQYDVEFEKGKEGEEEAENEEEIKEPVAEDKESVPETKPKKRRSTKKKKGPKTEDKVEIGTEKEKREIEA